MSYIDAGISEAQEAVISKAERQDLRIIVAEEKTAKSGRPMLFIMMEILGARDDGAEYQPVFHNVLLATEEEKEAKFTEGADPDMDKAFKNRKRWALDAARFLQAFNVPTNDEGQFDLEDLPGCEGNLLLGIKEYNDVESNEIKLPRLNV